MALYNPTGDVAAEYSRYAEAARKDIFMCIATEKRSISLEFKTNRQSVPSFAAIACNI